jgi:hypothetical protein
MDPERTIKARHILLKLAGNVRNDNIGMKLFNFIFKMNKSVSLPLEWIKEIKRLMTVNSKQVSFLTCTQKFHLYLHSIQILNIHTMYKWWMKQQGVNS